MLKKSIYVVEDEMHIQQLLKYNLESNGYKVTVYDSGENLIKQCENAVPDLFILDIMLPGIDGLEVCRQIRQNVKLQHIPIIMLTAKSEEFDKVLGLELGADDYLTKPFSVRELVARVKAIFRRLDTYIPIDGEIINAGNIKIDIDRHEIFKGDTKIDMPLKEFELLRLLIQNRGTVLTRDILLEKVWGFDYYGETRTVDVHIRHLRKKIEDDDTKPKYIETVRGVGYRFT